MILLLILNSWLRVKELPLVSAIPVKPIRLRINRLRYVGNARFENVETTLENTYQ